MPSRWRWKTISIWPSRATTCRSPTPTSSAPRLAAHSAASTPASCRELRAEAIGGFGTGAPGAGAGGTTGGAGGAGAGAAGLVQSTLGIGTPVQSYDPIVTATSGLEHLTQPLANLQIYGVPQLQLNTTIANFNYSQAFPTGTSFSFEVDNNRQATNSIFSTLSPQLGTYYRVHVYRSNCWPDSGLVPTCAICALPETTRRFLTSRSRAR